MKKISLGILLLCFSMFSAFTANADEILENGNAYRVPTALWHAHEDKESMGNRGFVQTSIVYERDGRLDIYLEVQPMTVADITTSVSHIYMLDEGRGDYVPAEEMVFDIPIPDEAEMRPRIFKVQHTEKKEFYDIKIDPKVEVMGKDPIKARLKLVWGEREEIPKSELPAYVAVNGEKTADDAPADSGKNEAETVKEADESLPETKPPQIDSSDGGEVKKDNIEADGTAESIVSDDSNKKNNVISEEKSGENAPRTVHDVQGDASVQNVKKTVAPVARERGGIIFLIVTVYAVMLGGGLYLCCKFLPLLYAERERSRYLTLYALRKEK